MELEQQLELKRLVDVYYDIQDVRIRTANRTRMLPQEAVGVYPERLKALEKDLKKQVTQQLKNEEICETWLKHVKGIGPCLAGGLLSNINVRFKFVEKLDFATELQQKYAMKTTNKETKKKGYLIPTIRGIQAFPKISNLWSWCGLSVKDGKAPKRQKGQIISWSPKMRVLCWKLGKSFVISGDFYQTLYKQIKTEYLDSHKHLLKEKGGKGHIDAMARRKTVKIFLQHLWVKWREMEGLPITDPYIIGKDGHSHLIEAPDFDKKGNRL